MQRISPTSRTARLSARDLKTASRTVSPADRREARGIVEGAGYLWTGRACTTRGGTYTVTGHSCSCPDFEYNGAELGFCKHIAAMRVYAPDEPMSETRERISPERIARLFGSANG